MFKRLNSILHPSPQGPYAPPSPSSDDATDGGRTLARSSADAPGLTARSRRASSASRPPRNRSPSLPPAPTVLLQHPDLPFSILQHDDGQVTLSQPLKLRRLVLTGGGAKGVVYPGLVKALEDAGQLAHIREIGGTSVGAIAGAMLAAGLDAEGCKAQLSDLNLPLLFSRTEKPEQELQQPSRKGSLASYLSIVGNRGTTAPNLKKLLDLKMREAALARIRASETAEDAEVQHICRKLEKGGRLSFGDLRTLSDRVPGIKKFYCTGTALYRGPGVEGTVPQLAIFSTEDVAFRDMEVSDAVCISAALPPVFREREHPMPHDLKDAPATRTRFTDGGLMLNTPLRELIDPDAPPEENLVISLQHPLLAEAHEGKRNVKRALPDQIIDKVSKTRPTLRQFRGSRRFLSEELVHGPMAPQVVEARLKGVVGKVDYSGAKGTLALAMTREEKEGLQDDLQAQVTAHLQQRSGDRRFDSLNHLLLSLKDDELELLRASCEPGHAQPILDALARIDGFLDSLHEFGGVMQRWSDARPRSDRLSAVETWMRAIDATLEGDEPCRDAFAEALVRSSDPQVCRMFDLLRDQAAPSKDDAGLQAIARRKDEARSCHRIAQRIRCNFRHPDLDPERAHKTGNRSGTLRL
jgi:predicted acylesterase/phospholipase RssA